MQSPGPHLIALGSGDGPPPPLAGALAVWLMGEGREVVILDPPGVPAPSPPAPGTLWIHLEQGCQDLTIDHARVVNGQVLTPVHLFGPGVDEGARSELQRRFPGAVCVLGDPEPTARPIEDLDTLPITTWAGFGRPGPAFRVLAGRSGRWRSPGHLLREVVYLVETWAAGHLVFDDADLAGWGDGLARFEAGLSRLPWVLTWEGTVEGRRRTGARGRRLSCGR